TAWKLIDAHPHVLGHGRRGLMVVDVLDLGQRVWRGALDPGPQRCGKVDEASRPGAPFIPPLRRRSYPPPPLRTPAPAQQPAPAAASACPPIATRIPPRPTSCLPQGLEQAPQDRWVKIDG